MWARSRALIVANAVIASAAAAAAADEDASPGTGLAEQMIGAYQAVESYHARWLLVAEDEAGGVSRSEVEIAFDRDSGMLLVRRQAYGGDGRLPCPQGELLVSDGQEIRVAQRLDRSAPPRTVRIEADAITYWVIERALSFQPIDLPLLLGESPVLGWLHMTGGTIDAVGQPLRELRLAGPAGGNAVNARLDAANFIREATTAHRKLTFLLEELSVNEPLGWSTFDFDAQSAFLGAS